MESGLGGDLGEQVGEGLGCDYGGIAEELELLGGVLADAVLKSERGHTALMARMLRLTCAAWNSSKGAMIVMSETAEERVVRNQKVKESVVFSTGEQWQVPWKLELTSTRRS